MTEDFVAWAARLAQESLDGMSRRWQHVQGVARHAKQAVDVVDDADLLLVAAWLHDIGYAPSIRRTGFHPVDGAEFLRQQGAPTRLCALVANHSCARVEARNRDIEIDWSDEQTALRDALWWADMTTTPTGETTDVRSRVAEVRERYGPDHVVSKSLDEAAPELIEAAERTEKLLHG
ncbi:HD domain-containing protein [Nocardia sp. NBC_00881]|uniref:HD domain-containing protein n=1 Tax=Nocardia sp. NBC_00881 TaxID=2975995 RepID=UPI00386FD07C|nr:HD domain-containing protein [Nocardia sp. NBC_00881]